jgi:hypothetical protein
MARFRLASRAVERIRGGGWIVAGGEAAAGATTKAAGSSVLRPIVVNRLWGSKGRA